MHGGTALQIGYGLPRPSTDADFEGDEEIDPKAVARELFSKAQPVAEDDDVIVVVCREDEVTLKRYVRLDERHIELHPESTNPDHQPIAVDLELNPFEIAGVAVGALIGDGFDRPGYEDWPA